MRILQEALTNVVKHSGAACVRIETGERMREGQPGVEVEIADDGAGFAASDGAARGGRGLRNMRERAANLDGQVEIESAAGATRMRLWLPLQRRSPPAG